MNATRLRSLSTATLVFLLIGATRSTLHGADATLPKTETVAVQTITSTKIPDGSESLATSVQGLRRDLDALQKKVEKDDKPWYLDVATIIAVLSFIFAFGTTWAASRKAKAQEIESDRDELRGLLQRMSALPRENLEAQEKFGANPGALATVVGYINQENTFLTGQAAEIARRLPEGKVSAVEYYAIALALGNAYELEGQNKFLALAIEHAKDFNTEIAAIRTTAVVLFQTGKVETGRSEYQKALTIFERYPGYDDFTKTGTHVKTEISWAYSEFQAHPGTPLSTQHLDRATELVQSLVQSPGRKQFEADIAQARQQLSFTTFPPKR